VLALLGAVFGADAARGEVTGEIRNLVGPEGAKAVESLIASAHDPAGGTLAALVGIATLFFGATGVFVELKGALDAIWDVRPPETDGLGVWEMVKDRVLSFSMICGVAFLLLVSLLVNATLTAVGGWLTHGTIAVATDLVLSLALTGAMFAMIFKLLPHARPAWRDVWVGAAFTAALFATGKFALGLYLGRAAVGSAYGAAGSLVVLTVWVYYSTQILLFGAELTKVVARRRGRK
jgi:membrane protein